MDGKLPIVSRLHRSRIDTDSLVQDGKPGSFQQILMLNASQSIMVGQPRTAVPVPLPFGIAKEIRGRYGLIDVTGVTLMHHKPDENVNPENEQ
jgi:hypothetical protein